MKRAVWILFFALCCHPGIASVVCKDSLQTADLLFVVNAQGNAITSVTEGYEQLPIDHVAIFYRDSLGLSPCVVQADYQGVRVCSLADFIADSESASYKLVVGRVMVPFLPRRSVENALSHVGKPYDFYFMPDDKEMYCSELVQKCYVSTSGDLLFSTIPMTFCNATGQVPDYWVKHYQKRGIPIPEGAPGTNPGELSRRPQVRILGELRP
ncbi:MAG: YiiX/YebB-like N1pC/P60 family cysteine hydrolase [Sodaliphilus sp.]